MLKTNSALAVPQQGETDSSSVCITATHTLDPVGEESSYSLHTLSFSHTHTHSCQGFSPPVRRQSRCVSTRCTEGLLSVCRPRAGDRDHQSSLHWQINESALFGSRPFFHVLTCCHTLVPLHILSKHSFFLSNPQKKV